MASLLLTAGEVHPLAGTVVVVANADDPESIALACAYQTFRGIPDNHLILLSLPLQQEIDRTVFTEKLVNPLRKEFMDRELVEGRYLGSDDVHGRNEIVWSDMPIRYLVLCRGVPLKIRGGANDIDAPLLNAYLKQTEGMSQMPQPFMRTNGSVDGELALLAHNGQPATGIILNPVMGKLPIDESKDILRVTRLDGPTNEDVLNMLEGVRLVEAEGLRGRAYFDLRNRQEGDAYRLGDDWIRAAAEAVQSVHFDTTIDHRPKIFQLHDRMDMPAIYVGWYTGIVQGPFLLPGFRFAPGAIAMHLHSTSAARPNLSEHHWVGPLISRGAAATVGNVYEPYLSATHHFDIILKALLLGHNFGDATHVALPFLGWQAAAFGDPLYQPFKVSHESMLKAANLDFDLALDQAVVLREVNRLESSGFRFSALELLEKVESEFPSPALSLALADRFIAGDEPEKARGVLRRFALRTRIDPQDWAVFREVAARLIELDQPVAGTGIYRAILNDARLNRDYRKVVLREALKPRVGPTPEEREEWRSSLDGILEQERIEKERAEAAKAEREAAKAKEEAAQKAASSQE